MQATTVLHNGRPAVAKTLRGQLRRHLSRQGQQEFLAPTVKALTAMEGKPPRPLPTYAGGMSACRLVKQTELKAPPCAVVITSDSFCMTCRTQC